MNSGLKAAAALTMVVWCAAQTLPLQPGPNEVPVRGIAQAVHFLAPPARNPGLPCILFAPGDGGWRGFAITIAEEVARWGYDVYGLDTRRYLQSFTGNTTLKETEVKGDVRTLAEAIRGPRQVLLIGWSEGAGLMTLAATAPYRDIYAGLITIGLGDRNVLAWRIADALTWVTRKAPNEPAFSARPYMTKISPLPVVVMQSSRDEYVRRDEAMQLFDAALEPKRFVLVDAQNHRFDGAHPEFFRQLKMAVEWATSAGRRSSP